ncbi:MAG: PQQ-binding-like beta-propeller repeat protein [Aureliella sp.]
MRPYIIHCTLLVNTLMATFAHADDWTQWRGPHRANRSMETGLFHHWDAEGPKLDWIAEGLGGGYASVSVAGNRIYTTGNFKDSQSAVAIDVTTGKVIWTRPITEGAPQHGYDGSRTTPSIDGDRLYMVSSDGQIICLKAADGSEIWRRNFKDWDGKMMSGWGFSESPLVDGDNVICTPGGDRGLVVALNKMTGEQVWAAVLKDSDIDAGGKQLNQGAGYASPIVSHGAGVKQYVQLVGRGLIGVRASDGKILWRYDQVGNTTANIPTAIVEGDFVFTSTGYGTGSALLKLEADGKGVKANEVYWLKANQLQNKHGGMTLVDGYIYCGHGNGDGKPICIEMSSGKVAWGPERAEGKGETSLIYADGHLIFRRENGVIILAKATPEKFDVVGTFQPVFQERESWSHPVIAGGKLYLREQNKLMCYDLK